MSLHGYGRTTTPNIDRFARTGYIFDHAYAHFNSTFPCVFSLLTGRYPRKTGLGRLEPLLSGFKGVRHMGALLREKGYQFLTVVGMEKGIFWYDSLAGPPLPRCRPYLAGPFPSRSAREGRCSGPLEATFEKTAHLLRTARRPFCLWVHTYQPHEPYLPSIPFRRVYLKDETFATARAQRPYLSKFYRREEQPIIDKLRGMYDEQILEVDFMFGRFLDFLREGGLLEESLVVITSDHGEMFEKGYQGHDGPCLYQPMLRIPLVVVPPGCPAGGGRRLDVRAGQADVVPTVLDLLGWAIPSWVEGRSLRPAMEGRGMESRPIFSLSGTFSMNDSGLQGGTVAVVEGDHKLIYRGPGRGAELYDILDDPGEERNLAGTARRRMNELNHLIRNRFLQ